MSNKKKKKDELTSEFSSISFNLELTNYKKNQEIKKVDDVKASQDFQRICHRFTTVLQMLWKYMHEIGPVAEAASISNFLSMPLLIEELTERQNNASSDETPLAIFNLEITLEGKKKDKKIHEKIPIFEIKHIERTRKLQEYHNAALNILHETALQHIINTWEKMLGDILAWRLRICPESATKNKEIKYSDVLSFESFNEVKEHIISKEVEDFIRKKSLEEQLEYFKKECKADISSNFPRLFELREAMLRRHAFVHTGGMATNEYLSKVKKIRKWKDPSIKAGTPLELKPSYIKNTWSIVYSAGVALIHLVATEYYRNIGKKDKADTADEFLINESFTNIQNNQLEAALEILKYAKKLKLATNTNDLMVLINLAQTYKWMNKEKECNELLKSYDWESCSSDFRLCVSALKNDIKEFKKQLKITASEKRLKAGDLFEWPVFRLLRNKEDFDKWVCEAFNISSYDRSKLYAPKIIDFNHEETVNEIRKIIESKTEKTNLKKGKA